MCLFHPLNAQYLNLNATGSSIRRHSELVLANPQATMRDVLGTSQALGHLQTISGWWQAWRAEAGSLAHGLDNGAATCHN